MGKGNWTSPTSVSTRLPVAIYKLSFPHYLMGINTFQQNRDHAKATPKSPKKRRAAAAFSAALLVQWKFSSDFLKQPKNNSILTGQEWLNELLAGNSQRFYDAMGMHKHVFHQLLKELIAVGLHDTRYVSAEEQLAIFIHLAVTGAPQ
ncbi:hypothetical protein PILCRDRAFT_11096 [Piloderma croceum F 1598]|uniref:DUF8040 domain-containing protein n=1 Tax=Piloderma croceum (strain F 1598) TaxID=765440 RepID=A0A0C3AXA4_PILCF|nr:hypothetical protein PILCRDRAFT_11096 [Piloderma croceum F 1598]